MKEKEDDREAILFSFVTRPLWPDFLTQMKVVPHLFLLGAQVTFVDLVGLDDDGDGVHDFDAVGGETYPLGGVVGDQPDMSGVQVAQDLGPDAVVAFVSLESQL